MGRIASATGVPCATRTSTWRSLEMISSGVCLFLPIVILLWLRSHTSGWTTPTGADHHPNPLQQHACRFIARVLGHKLAPERFREDGLIETVGQVALATQ